ncbi:M48 family metalloprotease [Streptomyces sp. NPDC026659]|uniref:M48 family metalloprotease n=1 Tax=Streptomyces sp. NPDC026659 TaxID=3155123 RepID=UPI0033F3520F
MPGTAARAALALVLLAGFYLLAVLILAAVAALDVILTRRPGFTIVTLEGYLGSAAIAWCVVRVVVLSRGRPDGREEIPGVSLTPQEQPELWERVRDLAERVGTRPPARIQVVPGAVAMVQEDARWLGLVAGERRLFLGAALLIGLPEDELDAVLGHELGHYAHHDTRLANLVWALRSRLLHTVRTLQERAADDEAEQKKAFATRAARRRAAGRTPAVRREPKRGPDHYLAIVFRAYAQLCLRLTEAVSRREEYAADLAAARVAGRDVTAAALRRIPVLDAADDLCRHSYVLMGWQAGLLPPEGQFHGGLALLLADGTRRAELEALAREPLPEEESRERSPYDSHPPTADRIAVLEALPDDGRGTPFVRRPASALLREPDAVLAALERAVLSREVLAMRRVPWAELPSQTRRENWAREADPLLLAVTEVAAARGVATYAATRLDILLDLLDLGLLHEVAERLPLSEQAARSKGRARREFARTAFRSALHHLALLTALDAGLCRWELCWAGPPVQEQTPHGFAEALEEALDHASADRPHTAPLRALLSVGAHFPSAHATPPPPGLSWPSSPNPPWPPLHTPA